MQEQLALRWALDGLAVKRSGKAAELLPVLEAAVANEVAARAAAGGGVAPRPPPSAESPSHSPPACSHINKYE